MRTFERGFRTRIDLQNPPHARQRIRTEADRALQRGDEVRAAVEAREFQNQRGLRRCLSLRLPQAIQKLCRHDRSSA